MLNEINDADGVANAREKLQRTKEAELGYFEEAGNVVFETASKIFDVDVTEVPKKKGKVA